MYVVLIGAPGSGKGTQAKILTERCGLEHVATGDLFREAVARDTPLGRQAKAYMDRGELVPDEVTIAMVVDRLQQPSSSRGIVLDGFPRNVEQARALDRALAARGEGLDTVIYLKVPTETLLRRLSGRWICRTCQATYHEEFRPPRRSGICDVCAGELYQRPDDRRETAQHRLDVYFESTIPVIDYYRRQSLLVEIDGDQPVAAVTAALCRAIGQGK